jgi:hypothetical protein
MERMQSVIDFFKEKVTANDMASTLLRLAMGMDNIQKGIGEMCAKCQGDLDTFVDECMFLQIFAVDYAASMTLGIQSAEKAALLDCYYTHVSQISAKMDSMDKTPGDSFITHVKQRLMIYRKAVTTPHPNGPAWNVGKEFARLCEKESNLDVSMFGNFLFSSSLKWASDTIKAYRIKV